LRYSIFVQVTLDLFCEAAAQARSTRPARFLGLVLCALSLNAQSAGWPAVAALTPGTEIRVDTAARKMRGVQGLLRSVSDDALIFTPSKKGSQGEVTIPRQDVTRLSVKKQSHRTRNTLIGAGIGGAAGLGIGLASRCDGKFVCPVSDGAITGGGAAAGAVVGAIIGALMPSGGWHEIYKP
jgi:hypothetical protein